MAIVPKYPIQSNERACSQLKTPIYMLGVGTSLIKQFFGSTDRLALEKASFRWGGDGCKDGLYVDHQDNADVSKIGQRPAVIVALGDIRYPQQTIADSARVQLETGTVEYLDFQEGSWNFLCVSPKSLECLSLAGEIKYFIQTYRHPIAHTYGLDKVRVQGITGYQELKEYHIEGNGCVVTVEFALHEAFGVGIESLKVGAMEIGLETSEIFGGGT